MQRVRVSKNLIELPRSATEFLDQNAQQRLDARTELELDIGTQIQFQNSPKSAFDARIRRVNAGFMKLFSEKSVPIDSRVQVLFRGQRLNALVAYCSRQDQGYAIGVSLEASRAGRRELRIPVHLPAQLTLPRATCRAAIVVADLSSSGFGIEVPVEVRPGTGVAINYSYGSAFGEIKYCLPKSGRYRAGIELEEFIALETETPSSELAMSEHPKVGLLDMIKKAIRIGPKY